MKSFFTARHRKKWIVLAIAAVMIGVFEPEIYVETIKTTWNYLNGIKAKPERIMIDISHKNFQKLAYKREVALTKGILITSSDDYVPAKIRYKDKTIKAKIRLKGDLIDQLQGRKWAFRIVIKGDNTLFGMKVFSIHTPKQRDYLYEWLLHKAMKREDVISLRYDFIDVTINGKHLGVYALEEHFEKRLIENNKRKEGPIVCFSEDADIENISHFGWPTRKRINFYSANVDLYRPTKTLADPLLREQFMLAKNLLESFRLGKLKASDVFDCKVMARYFAILDLFNARHAAKYGNLKFYYNPITSKLEPICFDAEFVGQKKIYRKGIYAENWYEDEFNPTRLFFKDEYLFELYMQELERISEPSYLDELFDKIGKELRKKLDIIHSENPRFNFDKKLFYSKQLYIKKILDLPVFINAYFRGCFEENGEKLIELGIGNIRPIPTQIISATLSDEISFPVKVTNTIIPPSFSKQPINIENIRFVLPQDFEWKEEYANELKLNYNVLGLRTPKSEEVIPWLHLDQNFTDNDFIRQASNIYDFDFLLIDETNKKIFIRTGVCNIERNLIIPRGYTVICPAGRHLNLANSANILSYSPLIFTGTEEEPIVIQSADATGQGLAVIGATQKSKLKHVIFKNLSNPAQGSWNLTGAVSFYKSLVDISHCQFLHNRSEDALNIIRCEFTIDHTIFNQSLSDAFDADFSNGSITNSSFVNCGNDAIDASGDYLELRDVFINGAGDKGVSAGENSQIIASQITIKNAEIAVASKDVSKIIIDKIDITNCKIGFASYQKKSEVGPASINVKNLKKSNVDIPYMVEHQSKMTVNKKKINPNQENVKDILYGKKYGKSSK